MKTILNVAILCCISAFSPLQLDAQMSWHNNPIGAVFARQGGDTPAGVYRFTSGGYEIYTLQCSDDPDMSQPTSLFYGKDNVDKEKVDKLAPDGRVPSAMNCYLVKIGNDYYMIDTGMGDKALQKLSLLAVKPGYIKGIFITHSHGDHIGGLLDSNGKAVYDNAILYIPEGEKDFMMSKQADNYAAITKEYDGRIQWIKNGEVLAGGMLSIAAPGHTPGHMVFRLGSLLFVGDIMHGAAIQLIDPTICARFDSDHAQSAKIRNDILNYAIENSLTVIGAHIPGNGVIF